MDLENTVRDLAPRLLRYCRARLQRAELAEEVAQDALAALVSRWRRSGPPREPAAFVFAIARRRAFRAGWKDRIWDSLEALRGVLDPRQDPEREALGREELRRLRERLDQLPAGEREALLLVAVAGLDREQAAAAAGITKDALKMRLHRARRRLEREQEVAHVPFG